MAKKLDKESVIRNKKTAIQQLNKLLEKYINDSSDEHLKKANLISYWMKDYTKYLEFEEIFDPKRYIAYKRGDVIKVSFGFNIGAEYGGLHYAIVLDNHNDHASPVITVIPLTSTKEHSKPSRHDVPLGNELYRLMKVKATAAIKASKEERENIEKRHSYFCGIMEMVSNSIKQIKSIDEPNSPDTIKKVHDADKLLEASNKMILELKEQAKYLDSVNEELHKIVTEVSRMKKGSTALVGQVTTISKMRIYDPKKSKDVLYGITISEENMEQINEKLKELYVFS